MGLLPVKFTKMSGAGNTFVIASALPENPWLDFEIQCGLSRSEFAKMVCDRILGIGADGFLLIQPGQDGADYAWDFYNSDGSGAEMCGNAARCAARFAYEVIEKKQRAHLRFKTGAGLVDTVILGSGVVRVQMPECRWVHKEISIQTNKNPEKFAFINSGVPHLVQKLHNISAAAALKEMAREVRNHHELKPNGANVTFYSVDDRNRIKAVSFERGVEDFTEACGTGAVAAAFAHHGAGGAATVEVAMPGGNLNVSFVGGESRPYLEGDAVFVGDFQYSLEVFL